MTSSASSSDRDRLNELRQKYQAPNILFFIARSKNENIVVYDANVNPSTKQLDSKQPVKVYWLDIDPEYVKQNRAKGITTDKSELNTLENQFAYGLSSEAYTGSETRGTAGYRVKLVALPERYLYVYTTPEHEVKGLMQINNKLANLQRVYVKSVDRMIGLPKVEYVELHGYYDDNSVTYEKIKQ